MPISTELTRMAQNVGALNADTNAIFEALRAKGVDVPANARLSDVADMIESIEVPSFLVLTYFEQKESGVFSSIYGGDSPNMSAYLGNETVNFSGIGDIITGKFSSSGGNWVRLFEFLTPDIFTIDFFINGNAPRDWVGFAITGSVYGIAGFSNQLAVGFGWDEYPTVTTYNGWYKHSSTAFIMNDNIGSKGHMAFVFNKTDSTTRCYVNGDLAYIRSEYAIADDFYVTFAHGNLSGQLANFAQLAVRSGDYSINNGQNFPVPTERYYS